MFSSSRYDYNPISGKYSAPSTTLDSGNLDQIHVASVMNSMCSCQQQKMSQRKRKSSKNLNYIHHRKAEKFYTMLRDESKAAKESWNGETRAFDREPCTIDATDMYTFDFQQNLPLPTLTHSDVFYCHQLWVYNFGIHDCVSDKGVMCLWDETTAKRGSSEVASCLHRCLSRRSTGAKLLVLFSDGCPGQNKNMIIATFLLKLVHDGQFDQIDHFFLVHGHTFLPND